MSASLSVRNLKPETIGRLRRRAAAHGRSAEAERALTTTANVVDASVAIKWMIEEPGTAPALAPLAHDLTAPDLLVTECANVLWRKQRQGEIGAREAGLATRVLSLADFAA